MKPEIVFNDGSKGLPLAVFAHGMGMNAKAWSNPAEARILGGKYPLKALFDNDDFGLETLLHDLRRLGLPILSWTQQRPAGPIQFAVEELQALLRQYQAYAEDGIILVCHSRGGLIARKYLECDDRRIKALVTLGTPHHGTSMAKLARYLSPALFLLDRLLEGVSKKDIESALQKMVRFLLSSGLKEMLPGSGFYSSLRDSKQKNVKYVSIGGTNPDLLKAISISIPELLVKLVPAAMIPAEMREGLGDGLVTAASATLPFADAHADFHVNHATLLVDPRGRRYIIDQLFNSVLSKNRSQ